MSNVLSIDIETGNTAADIGGWNNTHMWKVTCATTWDGEKAVVYMDNDIEMKEDVVVKSLRELKYDLDDHFEKGGKLLGHNIIAFDLPGSSHEALGGPLDGHQMAHMRPQDAPKGSPSDTGEVCVFLASRNGLAEHFPN